MESLNVPRFEHAAHFELAKNTLPLDGVRYRLPTCGRKSVVVTVYSGEYTETT